MDTGFRIIKGIENREQRIRISTYQKSCVVEYTVSDRLKFLFSVLCSLFLLLCGVPNSALNRTLIGKKRVIEINFTLTTGFLSIIALCQSAVVYMR